LSVLRSRKRRKTLPFARKGETGGAVFRFQDEAGCGLSGLLKKHSRRYPADQGPGD